MLSTGLDALGIASVFYEAAAQVDRWPDALARLVAIAGARRASIGELRQGRWHRIATTSPSSPGTPTRWRARESCDDGEPIEVELRLWGRVLPEFAPWVDALALHATRALCLSVRLRKERLVARMAQAALDRLAVGVIVLEEDRRVTRWNRAARELVERSGILLLRNGRLVARDPAIDSRITELVGRLAARSPVPSAHGAEHLQLHADEIGPIDVLGLPTHGGEGSGGSPCVLFLTAPEVGANAPEEVLACCYGLTRGEARVVAAILAGRSVESTARTLGIRRETVRTHLKRIFSKVGTTRQSDLIAILLRGPAGLRWD